MTRWGGAQPIPYERFRCGLTFADVRRELQQEQAEAKARGLYMYVTRKTVIGRMHEHKMQAYEHYLASLRQESAA